MNNLIGDAVASLLVLIVAVASTVGWIWNLVKIIEAISYDLTGLFILRCIGVFFAPLGAVLGFF